jgi:signal peptidase II
VIGSPVAVQGSRHERATALTRAGMLAAVVIGLDQLTKHTVPNGISLDQERNFIPLVKLTNVHNNGVAFNFLSGGGAIVLAFTLVALALLVSFLVLRPQRRWLWVPTGLLLGGALGNLIDRIANGYVTDFIKLPHWPAFNVADMAITFGVIALLLVLELGSRRGD